MVVKFFSCVCAVASGLPVGPEGPMIHLGYLPIATVSILSSIDSSIHQPFHQSILPPIHPSIKRIAFLPSLHPSIFTSVHLFVNPSVYQYFLSSILPSVNPSFLSSILPSFRQSFLPPLTRPLIISSMHLFIPYFEESFFDISFFFLFQWFDWCWSQSVSLVHAQC